MLNNLPQNHAKRWLPAYAIGLTLASIPFAQGQKTDEEVFELSPFVINADDNVGYGAQNTVAGSKIKTPLKDLGQAICAACPLAAIGRLRCACLAAWRPAGCACTPSSTGRGGTSGHGRCEASATGHGRARHRPRGPQAAGGPVPGGWPSPSPSRCGGAMPSRAQDGALAPRFF